MATNNTVDWQSTKKCVLERSCHMFNNPFMSDIKFTCEDSVKSFYAHKYVLGTSSAVFHAMFYGELTETKAVVHLSDTNEESLEQFLRFLYTDECDLTADNVVSVMYLSKKYIIPVLMEKCVEIMQNSLNLENVLNILEQAIHFDEGELEKKCWHLVESRTTEVATTEAFNNISHEMLACVLRRDHLNIPEVELFEAVLKWCDQQCSKNQLEVSRENRRAVLQDAVYDIAFLSMSQRGFAKHVHSSREPNPGELIPEHFHNLLKNDINYHLRQGEWVGYEKREEDEENEAVYVYAKIIEQTYQGGGTFAFNSKYKIDIGEEEPVEVSKLKLYKFDRGERNVKGAGCSRNEMMDLVPYEGTETGNSNKDATAPEPEPATLEDAKREVAEALKEIWQLPESERSSAIKRLIPQWYPDKNKHRESFATEVMKFLLNEVERLKKGIVRGYRPSEGRSVTYFVYRR